MDIPEDPHALSWDLAWAGAGDGVRGQRVPWARGRVLAAEALARVGMRDAAETCLSRAVSELGGSERAAARDLLRVALGALRAASPAGRREALAGVETAWGRHRRAALEALDEPPGGALDDLRQRSGDAHEDGLADAWRALVCALRSGACERDEATTALANASREAPRAPVTLRAAAAMSRTLGPGSASRGP